MKNTLKILLLVLLTASFTSCDMIEGWFTEEIKTSLEGPLNLVSDDTELKSTEAYSINGSTDPIDIADNDKLEPYLKLINDIKAKSVSLVVVSVDASDVVIHAGSEFTISSTTNPGMTWPVSSDWPIEVGTTINLTAENYNVLNDMLEDEDPITLTSSGTCNTGGVHILLSYEIEVVVEADPL